MLRVILVDDEEPVMDLMERLLSANGNVEVVGKYIRPDEAIVKVRTANIDAVFLDIQMPGMNGIEAAEHFMEAAPGIDIVFVTAYNQYAVDAFELSAIDYVLKPPAPDRLNKTIERLLRRRESGMSGGHAGKGEPDRTSEATRTGFYTFGRFEWIVDAQSGEAVKWRRSKERELMAYLIHNRNRLVPKEQIVEDLWPGVKPEEAAAFMHTCVYAIRKKMDMLGCKELLKYHNSGYRLELRELWCDVDEFEQAIVGGLISDEHRIGELERSASLYTGDYLEEDGFVWSIEKREKLKGIYIALMKRMAEYYRSAGNDHAALNSLLGALRKNPFLDDINESILALYARMGDRKAMIRHYEQFQNLLKEELGIAPMESTVQLFQRLCSGSAGDLA